MNKTAIIIPSRLAATRLPNKPLELIKNKEMILHVYEAAVKSNSGDVYVASPDQKIIDVIKTHGGKAIKTIENHETGTDRIYEVLQKELTNETNIIVNLQGDMPNINPHDISKLVAYMSSNSCEIGTLASNIRSVSELTNPNIVKVEVEKKLSSNIFSKAVDFYRISENNTLNLYHHIGIYAFTRDALVRYVKLKRSRLELERKLEQLRALENNLSIYVGYVETSPLSVDTKEDLIEIKKFMETNGK